MNRPYTFINVAMTADGKIDTFERKGAAISSKKDKERVDQLRAAADGILIGGRTLLEELPKLTVKSEALREGRIQRGLSPNPIKVGVVTRADIPLDSDFIKTGPARVVIFTTSQTSIAHVENLRTLGVEVFVDDLPRVDLNQMMLKLKKIGVDHLMVEGGGTMNFELIRLGLVDEIMMYVAPMIFGGAVAMLPLFADQVFHVGASGLGILRAAPSIGSFLTSVYITFWPPKKSSGGVLLSVIAGFGLCMIGFGLTTNYYLAIVFLAVSGGFDGINMIIRSTFVQMLTPESMRGRVSSLSTVFITSSNEIGAFESGVAANLLGLVPSVVFGGVMTLAVVLFVAIKAPQLRKTQLKHS